MRILPHPTYILLAMNRWFNNLQSNPISDDSFVVSWNTAYPTDWTISAEGCFSILRTATPIQSESKPHFPQYTKQAYVYECVPDKLNPKAVPYIIRNEDLGIYLPETYYFK